MTQTPLLNRRTMESVTFKLSTPDTAPLTTSDDEYWIKKDKEYRNKGYWPEGELGRSLTAEEISLMHTGADFQLKSKKSTDTCSTFHAPGEKEAHDFFMNHCTLENGGSTDPTVVPGAGAECGGDSPAVHHQPDPAPVEGSCAGSDGEPPQPGSYDSEAALREFIRDPFGLDGKQGDSPASPDLPTKMEEGGAEEDRPAKAPRKKVARKPRAAKGATDGGGVCKRRRNGKPFCGAGNKRGKRASLPPLQLPGNGGPTDSESLGMPSPPPIMITQEHPLLLLPGDRAHLETCAAQLMAMTTSAQAVENNEALTALIKTKKLAADKNTIRDAAARFIAIQEKVAELLRPGTLVSSQMADLVTAVTNI